ncbi:MAG: SDR family NAD(P)-dependent oxidoreductase [Deltaproteobacteria bacterium]|nr:SDR family NAD(P)-dependent oxidoreductase [Deltaproteobacteria bacterium]
MREFKGKVAVVTGAASGIGRTLAERCAGEGMKVVLADVEERALSQAAAEMKAAGATVLAVPTDVAKGEEVEALAQRALDAFGAVHLLCNNAGVGVGSSVWETTLNDWQWILGVNLWGVIHGARVFVPLMLAQDTDCHIVNTASIQGLLSYHPLTASYQVTKHAVVALSEQLFYELAQREAKVKVSVLCPGWVRTRIGDSGRNRPAALQNGPVATEPNPAFEAAFEHCARALAEGASPEEVADSVFKAIRDDRFYILPHPEWKPAVRARMEDILAERNPTIFPCQEGGSPYAV